MTPNVNLVEAATRKQVKTARFIRTLTGWSLDDCIEFAVLFDWHISQHRGADHLLKALRK